MSNGLPIFRVVSSRALLFVIFAACGSFSCSRAGGAEPKVVAELFAEQHLDESAWDIHQKMMRLPPEERYQKLMSIVFPEGRNTAARIAIDFSPTNPAPLLAYGATDDTSVFSGEQIVSPVLDLLSVAQRLDKLSEVSGKLHPSDEAISILLDVAEGKLDAATVKLEAFVRAKGDRDPQLGPSNAEMLLFQAALSHPLLRDALGDTLYRYKPWMNADWHRSAKRRHFKAIFSRFYANRASDNIVLQQDSLRQWHQVSRMTAQTRGMGAPEAGWLLGEGLVENVSSHDSDYLYFICPLRGNYAVECDVTGFEWRDSHLLTAGEWIAPVYTRTDLDWGSFANAFGRIPVEPKLTQVGSWIHYRTVVEGLTATTYFNGAKVLIRSLKPGHEPWLAIRSSPRHDGAVRNLRITGSPEIPEVVSLSPGPELRGWLDYYGDDGDGVIGHWEARPSQGEGIEIYNAKTEMATVGEDADAIPAYQESLLRYNRPMLEDGEVTYEFFYEPGSALTHPALDRLAFLLQPEGVRIHWLTDGRFDRTGIDPANQFREEPHELVSDGLPLRANEWNTMSVQLRGDVVTIVLNDRPVFRRSLDMENLRTFGLFHYADQSAVRVRNVTIRGDWPLSLPGLEDQELFVDETGFLERDFAKKFEHDFVKDELPLDWFNVSRGSYGADVTVGEEGVIASRKSTGTYQHATISPRVIVGGDFDFEVTYDQFESRPVIGTTCSLILALHFRGENQSEFGVWRRDILEEDQVRKQQIHLTDVRYLDGEARREHFVQDAAEERAGRLRLSRRGDQLYYLTAEHDSPHFQLRGQRTIPTEDVVMDDLRFAVQTHGVGSWARVIWKTITVRAERMSGPAIELVDSRVTKLNQEREQLSEEFTSDFTKQGPNQEDLYRWTDRSAWKLEHGGLLMTAPGTEDWTSAGLSVLRQVKGDFDYEVELEAKKLELPKPGERSSASLQVECLDQQRTMLSIFFAAEPDGIMGVNAEIRRNDDAGTPHYRHLNRLNLKSVSALRIARRGDKAYLLVRSNELTRETLFAQVDFPSDLIPRSGFRCLVHTGEAEGESVVLWKSLKIRAETIHEDGPRTQPVKKEPVKEKPVKEKPVEKAPSPLDRLFDLFR